MTGMAVLPVAFDPAGDALAFRKVLGAFATGVTVVTAPSADGPCGITANSFASLSLDPPLVLWSPAKSSKRYPLFVAAERFAIHVLAADQLDVCRAFTRSISAFDAVDWAEGADGVPLIEGCAARFDCRLEATHDAGDHAIVVARVITAMGRECAPLVFHGGQMGQFAAPV